VKALESIRNTTVKGWTDGKRNRIRSLQAIKFGQAWTNGSTERRHYKKTETNKMITKKATMYFSSNKKEIKIAVDITDAKTTKGIFDIIALSIQAHNMDGMRLESIYFSEENSYEKYNPLGIRDIMEGKQ
jgi:hypothetical protein